jgi:hypothetical protein
MRNAIRHTSVFPCIDKSAVSRLLCKRGAANLILLQFLLTL